MKTNNVVFAPSEDTAQHWFLPNLISHRHACAYLIVMDLTFLHADRDSSDQTRSLRKNVRAINCNISRL